MKTLLTICPWLCAMVYSIAEDARWTNRSVVVDILRMTFHVIPCNLLYALIVLPFMLINELTRREIYILKVCDPENHYKSFFEWYEKTMFS